MSGNVFQPNLSGVQAYTHVDRPVEDKATAQAFDFGLKGAVEYARRDAVTDLLGDADSADQAAGQEGDVNKDMALESINNLAKLARARKSGLGLDKSRDRARAILARAKNDNPLFAGDIQKAYNSYFGGGAGGLFELTPEEKADHAFREDVQMLKNQLKITSEDAADRIRNQTRDALRLKEIETAAAERNIAADEYNGFFTLSLRSAGEILKTEMFEDIQANGALTEGKKLYYKQRAHQLADAIRSRSTNLLRDSQGNIQFGAIDREGMDAAEDQVTTWISKYEQLADDQDLQTYMANNKEITNSKHRVAFLNAFGPLVAAREAGGPEFQPVIMQTILDNKPFTEVAKRQPFVAAVLSSLGDYEDAFGTASGASISRLLGRPENVFGARQKDVEAAGTLAMMSTNQGTAVLKHVVNSDNVTEASEMFRETYSRVPEGVAVLTNRNYKKLVESDPEAYRPILEKSIQGAVGGIKSASIIETGEVDFSIDIVPPSQDTVTLKGTSRGITQPAQYTGKSATPTVKARMKDLMGMANTYPYLWEDKYSNPTNYVRSLFGLNPIETKEE